MQTTVTPTITPVNIDERKNIGIRAGDTVRVWQKIEEKGKTRLQGFEGVVIARKHGNEAGATFTVRRVADGYGVEKIFPLYSPMIDKIEIVRRAKTRRAKLYHIRDKAAREIKRQMRRMKLVNIATVSETEEADRKEKEAVVAAQRAEEAQKVAEEAQKETQAQTEENETPTTDTDAQTQEAKGAGQEGDAEETKITDDTPKEKSEGEENTEVKKEE